jgi:ribulose bisphosphate carboxylase small subunit
MPGLFEYVERLTSKKEIEFTPEDFDREYSIFMINRVFSCDKGLAILANVLNQGHITDKMHFDFMDVVVPKGKRWIKYSAKKAKKDKEIEYLMEHYGCSVQTARQYHRLISKEEMKEINNFFERRGRKK